jgi:hypothetical protein
VLPTPVGVIRYPPDLIHPAGSFFVPLASQPVGRYLTSVTNGGRIVTPPADREADIQQAEVFHALLAQRRAALCDHLDQQAERLARYERNRDYAAAQRNRLRIKEIGAEIRDIDRMMLGLRARLLARSGTIRAEPGVLLTAPAPTHA